MNSYHRKKYELSLYMIMLLILHDELSLQSVQDRQVTDVVQLKCGRWALCHCLSELTVMTVKRRLVPGNAGHRRWE